MRNYTGYCNPDMEKLFVQQSTESDQQKRKKLVWEIDKKLQEDAARPIVYHFRAGTCFNTSSTRFISSFDTSAFRNCCKCTGGLYSCAIGRIS